MPSNTSELQPHPRGLPADTLEPSTTVDLRLLAANLLFGWIPPFVVPRIRTLALRAAGLQIGSGSIFFSLPTLVGPGKVQQRLRIGHFCGFNKGCYFDLEAAIAIGDHVAVGHDVAFITSGCETGPPAQRGGRPLPAPIVVGDGAWLGARSTVLPGVTIGPGSVVGAGVTVDQDVPAHTLVSGARPVSIARWR